VVPAKDEAPKDSDKSLDDDEDNIRDSAISLEIDPELIGVVKKPVPGFCKGSLCKICRYMCYRHSLK
jgi:hypothetical protein